MICPAFVGVFCSFRAYAVRVAIPRCGYPGTMQASSRRARHPAAATGPACRHPRHCRRSRPAGLAVSPGPPLADRLTDPTDPPGGSGTPAGSRPMPATIGGPFECAWRCFLSYWAVGVLVCGFSAKSCHDFFFLCKICLMRGAYWAMHLAMRKGLG